MSKRILVVEDQEDLRAIRRAFLSASGHQVAWRTQSITSARPSRESGSVRPIAFAAVLRGGRSPTRNAYGPPLQSP